MTMTAKEIISHIEKAYSTSELIYEMMLVHFSNLRGIDFQTIKLKKGSSIYRARFSNKLASFESLSEISYPPPKYVTKFSRLNRPQQNLFYASESIDACLTEMLPFWQEEFTTNERILVTLSRWIASRELKLLIIPDINNTNELNKIFRRKLKPEEIEFWNYISDKFKTQLNHDKNIYEFTSSFSNGLWLNAQNQKLGTCGFIYSSVQSPKFVNIAINPLFIDQGDFIPNIIEELKFKYNGRLKNGIPEYIEVGNRKSGFPNITQNKIEWND